MDPIPLGLTLTILGMGGTLLTLFLISLLVDLLKRLFPVPAAPTDSGGAAPPAGAAPSPPASS